MKYTINDLKEGKVIVFKDISNTDMFKLLQYTFPEDSSCRNNNTQYNNKYNLFQASILLKGNYIFLFDNECKTLPVVKASELLLELNKINNTNTNNMNNKLFTISGINALKKAFTEETGFTLYGNESLSYINLTNRDMKDFILQGTNSLHGAHFTLPQDWDKAIEFVNLNKPEDIVVDGYTAEFSTDPLDTHVKFGCHTMSLSELRAIKTVMNLREKLGYEQIKFNYAGAFPATVNKRLLSEETIDKLIERLTK